MPEPKSEALLQPRVRKPKARNPFPDSNSPPSLIFNLAASCMRENDHSQMHIQMHQQGGWVGVCCEVRDICWIWGKSVELRAMSIAQHPNVVR
ncbi:hypothetical protein OROGR_011352 [Orobanche gracilis]